MRDNEKQHSIAVFLLTNEPQDFKGLKKLSN